MGRKALPANVHLLHGNPSKKALGSLLDGGVRPPVSVPSCPRHLGDEAQKEWRRITRHLEPLGLISQIDRAALAGYCSAWGDYVWAELRIAALNGADPTRPNTEARGADNTGERGRIWDTPSGYKQISVPMQIRNRALEMMVKFLAEFGMSPAARSRVTPSDVQLPLPGMAPPAEGGWSNL
jgi:P27 family predicted phage terminase small subunit